MKNIIIATISILLFATGCNNQGARFATDVAVPVSVEEVKLKSIRSIYRTTGTVVASHESIRKSEISGNYQLHKNPRTGLLYRMGDAVKRGETIIRLIDREYENSVNLEGAKLDFEISEMEYSKQQALYEKGGVTLRELVNSEKALLTARKTYENAGISIEKMEIRATFDGVITALPHYSQEQRIETGVDLLALMDYKQLVLDLSFPENMLGEIKTAQSVNLMNYTAANDTLQGTITELSPAIDKTARTFAGRVTVINTAQILRPGMFVRCEVELQRKDSVITVPKELLLNDGNSRIVFVAERDAAIRREVQTGLEDQGEIEITSGLAKDERLIVKGYETLTNRTKIKIIN
ncbi:MAG: efflux RND transporter periplasmic adaptor subunit [Cytophagaceae bacterium]|jgi:RND family efflux transporter MFP subunit|nr:efflux RND transporter periplasmic adaptor subunit [Cytophagaceae bacterium]